MLNYSVNKQINYFALIHVLCQKPVESLIPVSVTVFSIFIRPSSVWGMDHCLSWKNQVMYHRHEFFSVIIRCTDMRVSLPAELGIFKLLHL